MVERRWVKTQIIHCERRDEEAYLLEERIYPADMLDDSGSPYRVRAIKCSNWLECNLSGAPCCWSGINPNYDPFSDAD